VKAVEIDNINELKNVVEELVGYKIKYAKNCDSLSEYIFEKTSNTVSSSTLKRFWGIINRKFNPSTYTLDTLSALCGYTDWDDFCKNKENRNTNDVFKKIHEKFRNISKANILFLKKQTPSFFLKISKREFALNKTQNFLNSDKKITSFIAHDGHGKTEILISLAEHFFIAENALYPDDLLLFINFSTVNMVEDVNYDIYKLLGPILEEESKVEIENRFIELMKGKRLVIFFDRICRIYKNEKIFPRILRSIYSILIGKLSEINIKIIVTCKSSSWNIFEREFSQSDYIKNKWFDFDFSPSENPKINIPVLSRNEIINFIRTENKKINYSYILSNSKLLEIISIPYFLNIYLNYVSQNNKIFDELDLLNYYITQEIFSGINAQEKLSIIEKILEATQFGKIKTNVNKKKLTLSIKEEQAYNKLLDLDFINEQISVTDYFEVSTQVNFSNTIIYRFVIVNSWLRKYGLTIETLEIVLNFYHENEVMKISLLIWLIKIASKKNHTEIFKNIYPLINEHFIKGDPRKLEDKKIQNLINTVGIELRKNIQLRQQLIEFYANDPYASDLYFRNFIDFDYIVIYFADALDFFLKTDVNKNDIFFSKVLIFWKHYLSNTLEETIELLKILENRQNESENKIYQIIYLACLNLYTSKAKQHADLDSIIKMYTAFNSFDNFSTKLERNFTYFMFLEVLETTQNFDLMQEFFEQEKLNDASFFKKNKYLNNFMNIYKAKLYLNRNKIDEAFELLDNIDSTKFLEGHKLFWKIKFNGASIEYLEKKGKLEAALKMIGETEKIADTLHYAHCLELCAKKKQSYKNIS